MRSPVFWISIVIGILGAGSFLFPFLGIPIAFLTIVGAWLQGYENARAKEDIEKLAERAAKFVSLLEREVEVQVHTLEHVRDQGKQLIKVTNIAREGFNAQLHIVKMKDKELFILMVIYSFCNDIVVPAIVKWIRKHHG